MISFLFILYFLLSISIFVYSYGFVDFNLTISSHPLVTSFVGWSMQTAMFNRPLSLNIYLLFVTSFFLLYLLIILFYTRSHGLHQFPWKIVTILSLILAVSYPLLSSDVFKYLFVGKVLVYYHANPYIFAPDHFSNDLWLRFMRWVHTTTPYGPVFSAMAVPYYILSLGKFAPMLYMFKLDQVAWYLLAIWLVGMLTAITTENKRKILLSKIYFAFNPLVMLEWLVNAHNDSIMITSLLLAIYLLTRSKRVWSFVALLFSIGIKFVTVIFLPFIFLKKFNLRTASYIMILALFLAPLLYHYSWQYQPWYVTWLVPFAAIVGNGWILWAVGAYTLGSLLRYIPFIATGLWSATLTQFTLYSFTPIVLVLLIKVILLTQSRYRRNVEYR